VPAEPVLTRDEARQRAETVREVSYAVALDLTGDAHTFRSTTRVTFAASQGADTVIDLVAERVHRAELNGAPLPADDLAEGRLHLRGLAADNELLVEADCAYERTGVGLHRFADPVDGAVYLHTQFEPFDAHRVYACFDQPDLKAPFALTVTAPSDWVVLSNTVESDRAEVTTAPGAEATRWTFPPTLPISTYLTALVAGPFKGVQRTHEGIELGWWARASLFPYLEADADELFTVTAQGFDYFQSVFAIPYPFGRYDQVLVPEFNFGAMENPGCVTYNEAYVFRSAVTDARRQARASTILHEMAHMWFGNLVTMRWWDDLWLNESFATYMGHRALVEATRFTDAWAAFAAQLKAWALEQDQLPSTHPITADLVDTDAIRTHFDGITYAKGASVLKQLVAWVGDEGFFAGIRDYFARHEYGNAELADFLGALEEASGRDLAAWSQEWLETSGVETLTVEREDGGVRLTPLPPEVGDDLTRRHRLTVGAYGDAGAAATSPATGADAGPTGQPLSRLAHATVDVPGQPTGVVLGAGASARGAPATGWPAPEAPIVLPNDTDDAFVKLRLDERTVAALGERLGDLDDAVASAVAWGALWEQVRDAELPAGDLVDLVARHAAALSDLTALQLVQRRGVAAADRYGAPTRRADAHARLLAAAQHALKGCAPGGDHQLAWVQHLIEVGPATDVDHRAWLVGLLRGEAEVPGLAVDQDLRWSLIVRLSADGAADEEVVAAELERDPTDLGVRRAATARAARPGAGSKEHAWQALLTDRELPLATLRAMASGFWRYGQEEVLAAFAERYPEAVAAAWRDRNLEEALSLTRQLYPSTVITERTLEIADGVLADDDLPDPARRVVSEERAGTARALAARQADAAD